MIDISSLTTEELTSLKEAINLRFVEKRREDSAVMHKEIADTKVPKLQQKYKKAIERLKKAAGEESFVVNIPIKFTLKSEFNGFHDDANCLSISSSGGRYIFGKIVPNAEGVTRRQRIILQQGIDLAIENACEIIDGLFPSIKEQKAAVAEFNNVMQEAAGLYHGDFVDTTWEKKGTKP